MEKSKKTKNFLGGIIMLLIAGCIVPLACFAWSAYCSLAADKGYPTATAMVFLMLAVSAGVITGFNSLAKSAVDDPGEFKNDPVAVFLRVVMCVLATMVGLLVSSKLSGVAQMLSDRGYPDAVSMAALLAPAFLLAILTVIAIRKRKR